MVSVCLPSDALLQHLPSYLGFSYLGCGVSLHAQAHQLQGLHRSVAERSYPISEVRGSGREDQPHVHRAVAAQVQEGLEELSHVEGQEGRR